MGVEKLVKVSTPDQEKSEKYYNDNLIIVAGRNGVYGYITRYQLEDFEQAEVYANKCLIDKLNSVCYECGGDGSIIGKRDLNKYEVNYNSRSGYGDLPTVDIHGNPIIFEDFQPVKENKKEYTGQILNVPYINLCKNNIRKFWEIFGTNKIPEDETNLEKMIRIAVLNPDQFDEIFTVEVDKPESPLMVKFLNKLAELVDKALLSEGDNGLENIVPLQREAYNYAGYEGKSFETVIDEHKDYGGYFRFLLTKEEKTIISENEKLYFDNLIKIIEEDKNSHNTSNKGIKKKKQAFELFGTSPISSFADEIQDAFYFKGIVPNLNLSSVSKPEAMYFTYIDDIYKIYDYMDNSDLSFKIALNDDLLLESGLVKKGVDLLNKIFVCDKNFNIVTFTVRKATLNKWKKNLGTEISKLINLTVKGETSIPQGFGDLSL